MDTTAFLELIAAIAGGLAGLGFLYKKVVRPAAKTLVLLEEAVPVLTDISHEFKNNSGSSLKDHLDKANAGIASAQHDSSQTRQALGLYISITDKRLAQIDESLNALNQAVVNLTTPRPRKPRVASPRPPAAPKK